jgi:hypothetical protein
MSGPSRLVPARLRAVATFEFSKAVLAPVSRTGNHGGIWRMSMQYLGAMRGTGRLAGSDGQAFGPVDYDVDGYLMNTGKVVASGELRMPAEALTLAFGRNDLRLFTEDLGELTVRFSGKRQNLNEEAAHIDVTEGLPPAKKWRH